MNYTPEKKQDIADVLNFLCATYDLFEETRVSENPQPLVLKDYLTAKHSLKLIQKQHLHNIAINLDKIVKVVKHIENRFGVDKDHKIINSAELYRHLYVDEQDPKTTEFESFNFGLANIKNDWAYDNVGHVRAYKFKSDSIDYWNAEDMIRRFENRDKKSPHRLIPFIAVIPTFSEYVKTAETLDKTLSEADSLCDKAITTEYKDTYPKIILHEMRHIIDHIINNTDNSSFVETQAYMYSSANLCGFSMDKTAIISNINEYRDKNPSYSRIAQIEFDDFEPKAKITSTLLHNTTFTETEMKKLSYIFSVYPSGFLVSYMREIAELKRTKGIFNDFRKYISE
jgi:hypothetical protein